MKLVEKGKSEHIILIVGETGETIEFAARELQKHIRLVSGARLPITRRQALKENNKLILLGTLKSLRRSGVKIERIDLGEEGFLARTLGNTLILAGAGDTGALYAVYTFLEEYMGARWFDLPTGEILPERATIQLPPIDLVEMPSFPIRGADLHACRKAGEMINKLEWMAKKKLNYALVFVYQTDLVMKLLPEFRKRGVKINMGGHSWTDFLYGGVRFEEKLKAHPEWHVLVNGLRLPCQDITGHFCLSSQGAIREFTRNVIKYVRSHPEIDILSLWMSDSGARWCECEECRKAGTEDTLIRFINHVAREVYKINRTIRIETIAYSDLTSPPRKTSLFKNVCISFAPWGRNYHYPIISRHWKHKAYADCIKDWKKLSRGKGNLVLMFEYYKYDEAPKSRVIKKDLEQFKALGLGGVLDCPRIWDNTVGFNGYLLSKLLWNVGEDVEGLLTDAFARVFGDSTRKMRACHDILERILPLGKYMSHWMRWQKTPPEMLEAQIIQCREAIRELERCQRIIQGPPRSSRPKDRSEVMIAWRNWISAKKDELISTQLQLEAIKLLQTPGIFYVDRTGEKKVYQPKVIAQVKKKLQKAVKIRGMASPRATRELLQELEHHLSLPAELIPLIHLVLGPKATLQRLKLSRNLPAARSCKRRKESGLGCEDCLILGCPDYFQDDSGKRYQVRE